MYDAGVNVNHVDDVELIDDVVIADENLTLLIVQVLPISPSRLLKGP